jgi:hypothetical protein
MAATLDLLLFLVLVMDSCRNFGTAKAGCSSNALIVHFAGISETSMDYVRNIPLLLQKATAQIWRWPGRGARRAGKEAAGCGSTRCRAKANREYLKLFRYIVQAANKYRL